MYIKSIAAKNTIEGWELEEMAFDENFTLLVGISGAGKTQILKSIYALKTIINGESIAGFGWYVTFALSSDEIYEWKGQFISENDNKEKNALENNRNLQIEETLKRKDKDQYIINRTIEKTVFNGNVMPRLPKDISTLTIFKEESILHEIRLCFNKMFFKDNTNRKKTIVVPAGQLKYLHKYTGDIEHLKALKIDSIMKLLIAINNQMNICKEIKEGFTSVFKEVDSVFINRVAEAETEFYRLQLGVKVKGTNHTVDQDEMSSGMLRFLVLLIELSFAPKGTVLIIDELENSLGINCLDEYVNLIQDADEGIQIIATSHHPYIINNIPYQEWKVVKREGARIKAKDAEDLGIGQSRQDAFIQLNKILNQ